MKKIENVQSLKGKVYYGLHFSPGTAEYQEPGKDPYKILINENTIRQMNSTFAGCPVFIDHVDEVTKETIPFCVGYVIDSFYNAADGCTWAKFIVTHDEGVDVISKGYKLSNAYVPKQFGPGGMWHGMEYQKEVLQGEFEHLAIVNNPRYAESVILDPEQFKRYNENKTAALQKVANSLKEKSKMKFNLFKREKVENALDLENTMVTIGKKPQDMTLANALEIAEKYLNMHGYADSDHRVKVGNDEMSVGEMVDCYGKMKSEMEEMKKNMKIDPEMGDEEKHEPEMDEKHNESEGEKLREHGVKVNEEDEESKKKALEEADKKKNNFEKMKNAHANAKEPVREIRLGSDRIAKGRELMGSGRFN